MPSFPVFSWGSRILRPEGLAYALAAALWILSPAVSRRSGIEKPLCAPVR
jgi:hypothetical protein